MYLEILKSKIHRVTVTKANLHYIGSITIDVFSVFFYNIKTFCLISQLFKRF